MSLRLPLRTASRCSRTSRLTGSLRFNPPPNSPSSQAFRLLSSRSRAQLLSPEHPHLNGQPRSLRRFIQTQRYQGFVPPSPESLGKAAPPKQYPRSIKWGRRLLYVGVATGALYLIDTQFYASSITRTVRVFGLGLLVALDYKLNFRPEPFIGDIPDLHRRSASE
jgi:aarF domain-containing kinase